MVFVCQFYFFPSTNFITISMDNIEFTFGYFYPESGSAAGSRTTGTSQNCPIIFLNHSVKFSGDSVFTSHICYAWNFKPCLWGNFVLVFNKFFPIRLLFNKYIYNYIIICGILNEYRILS